MGLVGAGVLCFVFLDASEDLEVCEAGGLGF